MDEESVEKQTAEHLLKIGKYLASSCPPASRFYISNLQRFPENSNFLKTKDHCQHCGSIWTKDNCTIYMKKRPPLNKKMKKLIEVENWKKSKKLKKKINKFCGATNKLVYTCLICKHKTFYPGTKKIEPKSCRPPPPQSKKSNPKVKRRDWNAGLFLSPCQLDNSEKSGISESMQDPETETAVNSEERKLLENKSPVTPIVKISNNSSLQNKATPKTVISSPENISEKQSSSKKRKKTLLAQILSKEQNKKKKPSIASFLQTL